MKFPRSHLFLSDVAQEGLQTLARDYFHLKAIGRKDPRVRLADLIGVLPEHTFYRDARPTPMVRADHARILDGEYPVWSPGHIRFDVIVRVDPIALQRLSRVSDFFQITNHTRYDGYKRELSRISATLEALGLGYLRLVERAWLPGKSTHMRQLPKVATDIPKVSEFDITS